MNRLEESIQNKKNLLALMKEDISEAPMDSTIDNLVNAGIAMDFDFDNRSYQKVGMLTEETVKITKTVATDDANKVFSKSGLLSIVDVINTIFGLDSVKIIDKEFSADDKNTLTINLNFEIPNSGQSKLTKVLFSNIIISLSPTKTMDDKDDVITLMPIVTFKAFNGANSKVASDNVIKYNITTGVAKKK